MCLHIALSHTVYIMAFQLTTTNCSQRVNVNNSMVTYQQLIDIVLETIKMISMKALALSLIPINFH